MSNLGTFLGKTYRGDTTYTAKKGDVKFALKHTPGLVDVLYNGITLDPTDFTDDSNFVYLKKPVNTDGDEIRVRARINDRASDVGSALGDWAGAIEHIKAQEVISSGGIRLPSQSGDHVTKSLSKGTSLNFACEPKISHPELARDSSGMIEISKAGVYEMDIHLLTRMLTPSRGLYFSISLLRAGQLMDIAVGYRASPAAASSISSEDMHANCLHELRAGDKIFPRLFTLDATSLTIEWWSAAGSTIHASYTIKRIK